MAVNQKIIRLCVVVLQFSILFIQTSFAQPSDEAKSNEVKPILKNEEGSSLDPTENRPENSIEIENNAQSSDLDLNQTIIERVQLVVQPGSTPDENIISCYFIFWNNSPDFFYEMNQSEKQLIFELKDTKVGSTPILSFSEPPINNFVIKQDTATKIKTLKGREPQWDNLLRIAFNFEAVPNVHVNNEDGIIYFSFKWTSDSLKLKNYTVKKRSSKIMLLSSSGVGGIAIGALGYLFIYPQLYPKEPEPPTPLNKLSIGDLPTHPSLP